MATQEAAAATSRVDGWFRKYIGRDTSPNQEVIKIRALYRRFIKRTPSRAEVSYWLRRLSESNLLIVRYEIATSREAGKALRLNPKALLLEDQHYVTKDDPNYLTKLAQKRYLFACDPKMYQMPTLLGAQVVGPWISRTTFDLTAKPTVQGSVSHPVLGEVKGTFSIGTTGKRRFFHGNGIPIPKVLTGIFPVKTTDPAYQYDPNPNGFEMQTVSFFLPRHPKIAAKGPYCTYKEMGITLDGVPITSPFDPKGRNEVAYEVQDLCNGTTQPGGLYHRHGLPYCYPHAYKNNALVGYAFDGFGIYSPFDENGIELTSDDLDECHGKTSWVIWEGKRRYMYHYVATRDFPYTVGCFRGTPVWDALPPLPGAPPTPHSPAQ